MEKEITLSKDLEFVKEQQDGRKNFHCFSVSDHCSLHQDKISHLSSAAIWLQQNNW